MAVKGLFDKRELMIEYKLKIKNTILMIAVGIDFEEYNEFRKITTFGYDTIDIVFFEILKDLPERLILPVGLAYKCHEKEEIDKRLSGQKSLKRSSFERYLSDAKADVINKVKNNRELLKELRAKIEKENEEFKNKN